MIKSKARSLWDAVAVISSSRQFLDVQQRNTKRHPTHLKHGRTESEISFVNIISFFVLIRLKLLSIVIRVYHAPRRIFKVDTQTVFFNIVKNKFLCEIFSIFISSSHFELSRVYRAWGNPKKKEVKRKIAILIAPTRKFLFCFGYFLLLSFDLWLLSRAEQSK